jgi:diguanylate cyclase (GGDEF)-like protein
MKSADRFRAFVGPLVAGLVGIGIVLVDRFVVPVPSPAPSAFMLFAVLFAAYVGGVVPGLISAAIAIEVVAYSLSEPGQFLVFTSDRQLRFGAYSLLTTLTAILVGLAQQRAWRALEEIRRANVRLEIARLALDRVEYGVIILDKHLRAQFINPRAYQRARLRPRGPDERPIYADIVRECALNAGYAIPPDKLEEFIAERVDYVRAGNLAPVELRMADGSVARFQCTVLPDGGRMLTYTDVTDLTRQRDELYSLRAALDQADVGLLLLDSDLRVRHLGRAVRDGGLNNDRWSAAGMRYEDLLCHFQASRTSEIKAEDFEEYVAKRIEYVRSGNPAPVEIQLVDGSVFRSKTTVLPDGGRMITYVNVTDLVNRSKELEAAYRKAGALRAALDELEEGVVLLDKDLRADYVNRAIREIGGLRERKPEERPAYAELLAEVAANRAYAVPDDQLESFIAQRVEYVRSGNPKPVELRMADGKILRFKCTLLPDGGRMLIYANITDLVRNADKLEKLATTDGMTGLYNRRHFLKLAETEWARFERYGRPLSYLLLDFDFFKSINDRFGHDVGDEVIFHVAAICCQDRRATDVVARIGGEEFAILLPETSIEAARMVAERLRENVESNPLQVDGRELTVTISVGVAEAQAGMNGIFDLMKAADRALYEAKRTGRNRVVEAADLALPPIRRAERAPLRSV